MAERQNKKNRALPGAVMALMASGLHFLLERMLGVS